VQGLHNKILIITLKHGYLEYIGYYLLELKYSSMELNELERRKADKG
jgi:hypothetical protein